eukprot:2628696-Pleurochrysis_carterae.AAC.1
MLSALANDGGHTAQQQAYEQRISEISILKTQGHLICCVKGQTIRYLQELEKNVRGKPDISERTMGNTAFLRGTPMRIPIVRCARSASLLGGKAVVSSSNEQAWYAPQP